MAERSGIPGEAPPRLWLSPPHMSDVELSLVQEVFASNWVAPAGPHLERFERAVARAVGVPHAAALSSGTAAIHLALQLVGVEPGDEVICPTLTFCATANPILYENACPVFIDSERRSWNMDPELLSAELDAAASRGKLPRAVIVVHLYGQSADLDPMVAACARHRVPLIEDAAEALGATYRGKPVGGLCDLGVISFNGNKIITTSGGGMLVSRDEALIERARFLATQAKDPTPYYQHSVLGYNYRMSNVLAAIGLGQMKVLDERVAARRRHFDAYQRSLGSLPGVEFMPEAAYGRSNRWLTCLTFDADLFGATPESVRLALDKENIEARPVWKPLHSQPFYERHRTIGGSVAEHLFATGLCLPSGSGMTSSERERVIDIVRSQHKG